MKTAFLLFAALALLVTGCGKEKTQQVHGQAFIVLAGRDTVKLSLVEVVVLTEREALGRLLSISNQIAKDLPKLAADYRTVTADKEKVESQIASLERRISNGPSTVSSKRSFAQEYLRSGPSGRANAQAFLSEAATLEKELQVLPSQLAVTKKLLPPLKEERRSIMEKILRMREPDAYFLNSWTGVVATVTTDADGNFSVPVKHSGRLFVSARASRKTMGGSEDYGWIVPASTNRVFLSNNNQCDYFSELIPDDFKKE